MAREVQQATHLPTLWVEPRLASASVEDFVIMCRCGLNVFQRVGRSFGENGLQQCLRRHLLPSSKYF